jgi:hypothetical protein
MNLPGSAFGAVKKLEINSPPITERYVKAIM